MHNPLTGHFQTLALYNKLANGRLYKTCALLPDAELKKRRKAFFGSIHGTLNHIMVGDRIWLSRFSGEEAPSTNLDATKTGASRTSPRASTGSSSAARYGTSTTRAALSKTP